MLTAVSGGTTVTFAYDPIGRLSTTAVPTSTTFLYDSDRLVAEYNAAGTLLRRYVHGPGVDEPLVWYEGASTSYPQWLHQDRQGSVIAWSSVNGYTAADRIYKYGAWGEPDDAWASGASRFRYTGQIAIPEARLYYYKARMYDPATGRFMQTDPIGYKDDLNLYAYVRGDPISNTDPTGTDTMKCVVVVADNQGFYKCTTQRNDNPKTVVTVIADGIRSRHVVPFRSTDPKMMAWVAVYMFERFGFVETNEEPIPRTSAAQMEQQVRRGQAPRGVDRVDRGLGRTGPGGVVTEKDHVALSDGRSLNYDGTWKHGSGGRLSIPRPIREWLWKNGWAVPE